MKALNGVESHCSKATTKVSILHIRRSHYMRRLRICSNLSRIIMMLLLFFCSDMRE